MRTLSIQQPYASLVVAGIKDIENRTWAPKQFGKILIHASQAKVTKNFENELIFEQYGILQNEQLFGNFPMYDDLERSAIIGYATVKETIQDSLSPWAFPVDHQWVMEDAYIFDEPIRDVKGKLNLWDYPSIDKNNLPKAHKLVRKVPQLEGTTLVVPITEEFFDKSIQTNCLHLCATTELENLILTPGKGVKEPDNFFKKIEVVKMVSPTRYISFKIEDFGQMQYNDENGNLVQIKGWDFEDMPFYDYVFK
jgi:hypothetical protein